ncbi:biotin--[acetyl-CoA-carboxylase] ligase [Lysobacter humi (ex Lee et al. 2017)]
MDERALLQRLIDGPVSGDALARAAGQTRAAVWKRVEALREAGVPVEAAPGRGYRLVAPLELLDADRLHTRLIAAGVGLERLDVAWSIDSTNSELLRQPPPAQGARVLIAERQTGGRGRRGRAWASPLGSNLYLSVLRVFDGGLARLGGLSLVAGVAVADALRGLGFDVGLKWPNDLVVAEDAGGLRKLGGLLVEGGGEHAGPVRAVIGLGLNVRMPACAAAAIDQPWNDLAALQPQVEREAVALAVLAALLPALDAFDRDGLAPVLARWPEFDALAGRAVHLHGADGVHEAQALGLADDGALRVRHADGREAVVHAGEVSLRPAS